MGKIEEMRRQREAQIAQQEGTPVTTSSPKRAPEDTARCAGCGKLRAVQRGVIVNHQKGLGKMCAGSRKEPEKA